MEAKQSIPDKIRDQRISLGLMQQTVGEACGYEGLSAQVQVAKWETGYRPVPRSKLKTLAKTLQMDVADLIPD